jgi:hypothetical protein
MIDVKQKKEVFLEDEIYRYAAIFNKNGKIILEYYNEDDGKETELSKPQLHTLISELTELYHSL